MKKFTSLLATLALVAPLAAQDASVAAPPPRAYSATVDFPYTQSYVFRGIQYAEESLQPGVKVTVGNFYAGVWSNAPLSDGYELEVDYYAGYNFALSNGWSLDAGATLYSYPGLDVPGADKTTFEPYVGLNGTFGVVNSASYIYYDTTLDTSTVQQTFSYAAISDERVTFNLVASVGGVQPKGGDNYTYWGAGVTLTFKVLKNLNLNASGQYAGIDNHQVDDTHFWSSIGATFTY